MFASHNPFQINGLMSKLPSYMLGPVSPSRTAPDAPRYTPGAVANRYVDGEHNFRDGRWNAAVAMYRSSLDIATKALEAPGATFFLRLRWLEENHRITKDIWEWATKVRLEGNDALHDPEEFTQGDSAALRYFTEMFLRYVFQMPEEVKRFRTETGSLPAS
jgi:hypothetical protein